MAEKKPSLVSVPVLAVITAMGFVYCSTVFVFLDELLGLRNSSGVLNTMLFDWIALMCLVSFFVAAVTDPGGVPSSFAPEAENPQKEVVNARYCEKCSNYKPPGAHHCRVCKRCVLKMDHQCVWINSCVGYKNYKPFIIFILHAALGSVYSLVIFTIHFIYMVHDIGRISLKLFYVLSGMVMIGLSLSLSSLLGWHIYLLAHNMTTIDYQEAVKAKWLAEKRGQQYWHPFDLGIFQNFILALGPNMLQWCFPTAVGHLKDGTHFPISND